MQRISKAVFTPIIMVVVGLKFGIHFRDPTSVSTERHYTDL